MPKRVGMGAEKERKLGSSGVSCRYMAIRGDQCKERVLHDQQKTTISIHYHFISIDSMYIDRIYCNLSTCTIPSLIGSATCGSAHVAGNMLNVAS